MQGNPLRQVTHAVVGHACAAQSWHLEWLEVQLDGSASGAVRFYHCDWLSLTRGPGRLQACLSSTADPMVSCLALVRTGDCRCAGTSAGAPPSVLPACRTRCHFSIALFACTRQRRQAPSSLWLGHPLADVVWRVLCTQRG